MAQGQLPVAVFIATLLNVVFFPYPRPAALVAAASAAERPNAFASLLRRGAAGAEEFGTMMAGRVVASSLRAGNATKSASASCTCQAADPSWRKPTRTTPQCVFIDLGAADGNSFRSFLKNEYGPVANCPGGGKFEAYLVEANPRFDTALKTEAAAQTAVHALPSTAAYMCEGHTTFYLDTVNPEHNYWGSSMSRHHPAAKRSGHESVTVPTVNLLRLLYETTIPQDWVMVKMDIEGAEFEILPCLASAPQSTASLVDALFVEQHPYARPEGDAQVAAMPATLDKLRGYGVQIPDYHSPTLLRRGDNKADNRGGDTPGSPSTLLAKKIGLSAVRSLREGQLPVIPGTTPAPVAAAAAGGGLVLPAGVTTAPLDPYDSDRPGAGFLPLEPLDGDPKQWFPMDSPAEAAKKYKSFNKKLGGPGTTPIPTTTTTTTPKTTTPAAPEEPKIGGAKIHAWADKFTKRALDATVAAVDAVKHEFTKHNAWYIVGVHPAGSSGTPGLDMPTLSPAAGAVEARHPSLHA